MSLELHYQGDLTAELPRRVLGPDTVGGLVVVDRATYDADTDRTTAHCIPLSFDAMELVRHDEHGQMCLPLPEGNTDGIVW